MERNLKKEVQVLEEFIDLYNDEMDDELQYLWIQASKILSEEW